MKKYLFLILFTLSTLPAFSAVLNSRYEYEGLCYCIYDNHTCDVTDYEDKTYNGVINIPQQISYNDELYEVTAIDIEAFKECGMTSVNIPNSVTSIGKRAFKGCSNLTSVNIPESVTSIESNAFAECSSLTRAEFASIESLCKIRFSTWYSNPLYFAHHLYIDGEEVTELVITESVTSIGNCAFTGCSSITSVSIPESVTSIGANAFAECTNLTSVSIPESVSEIGASSFYGCSSLTSVSIPASVTSIGSYAFNGCSSLTSVNIPESVTSIGNYTFNGCSSLTSVIISESVSEIGNYAFADCSSLTSVNIPKSVTTIGIFAFAGCSSLTSINIPESVTTIGSEAFDGCSSMTSVSIAESVTSIGDFAFYGCTNLTKAEFASIESLCKIEFTSTTSNPLYFAHHLFINGEEVTELVIPESVTSIGNFAFTGCSSLTSVSVSESVSEIRTDAFQNCSNLTKAEFASIESLCKIEFSNMRSNPLTNAHHLYINGEEIIDLVIPESVTSIGKYAFFYCSSLTSVNIPESVTSIGPYAIGNCSSLTYFNIPESVTSIGYFALAGCSSMNSVSIPNSVTSIGSYAFAYCSNLKEVYYAAENPIEGDSNIFESEVYANATLYVPSEAVAKAKTISPWMLFNSIEAHNFNSEIDDVMVNDDPDAVVEVFNLNGVKVYEGSRSEISLPKALYILVKDGKASKMLLGY